MSASQDKKKRQAEREAGTEKRQVAAREAEEKARKTKMKWTFGTVVVILLVAVILIANSGLFYTVLPSVTIGDMKYTNAEYQYFYYSGYYKFVSSYGDYISYIGLDTSKPLSEQPCSFSEGQSWAEYFRDDALKNMTTLTAVYSAAVADGYTLSEEDAAEIDESVKGMEQAGLGYGYKDLGNYISAVYGRGCNEKIVRELTKMQYIAADYEQDHRDSYKYSQADLDSWYEKNKDANDRIDYLYYEVKAETVEKSVDVTDEETGEVTQETKNVVTEETMAGAKADADRIAESAADKDSFYEAVAAVIGGAEEQTAEPDNDAEPAAEPEGGDAEPTAEPEGGDAEAEPEAGDAEPAEDAEPEVPEPVLSEKVSGGKLDSLYSGWLLDGSRRENDVTVIEKEDEGYYVVMFLGRDDNNYKTVSVRHILMKGKDSDEDGTVSDAENKAAETELKKVLDEWKAGAADEESFAGLAEKYSEDPGSVSEGGLYENVMEGQMVPEFDEWIYDPARKPGDTGIVYSSSTGYHLIYFCGNGMVCRDFIADSNLRGEDFSKWHESLVEGWEADTNIVLKFASE